MTTVSLDPAAARGREFARFIKAMVRTRGDAMGAERFAEAEGWRTTANVLKALVSPLSEAEIDNGLAPVTNDLASLLRSLTIVGRLQNMVRVPFRTRLLTQSVGGSGDWVGEGLPIPVTAAGITNTTTLDAKKVAGIRVLTEELTRGAASGGDALIANDAASGVVEALDIAFIDPANGGSTLKPASISYGATAINSTGSTVAAIDADLALMLAVLISAECSLQTAAWVMSPTTATHLTLLRGSSGAPAFPGMNARGGMLLGLPVITSTNIAASGSPGERFVTLVEANQIFIADENQARIELSTKAAVQMDDAPAAGSQQLVSLWQAGLVGIKATRFVNWSRRRTGAVAVLRNVNY